MFFKIFNAIQRWPHKCYLNPNGYSAHFKTWCIMCITFEPCISFSPNEYIIYRNLLGQMAFKNGIHLLDLHVMLAEYRYHKTNRYHEDYTLIPLRMFSKEQNYELLLF